MDNQLFPWQESSWQQLQQLRQRLPHAMLFHGPQGIGKTLFAERFAQALLCQTLLADGQPCGACESCGWFVQYSHPDYRRIRPEALEDEPEAEGEEEEVQSKKASKSAKPSKDIKIDQVRALADFMNISTHRQGLRLVLLHPAEALNTAAANALLKTLEEPPPQSVFLLVCDSLDRLLPTILSRCRKFALPLPAADAALAWLNQQQVADPESWLAEQGGAPLAAYAASQQAGREGMDELLRMLAQPDADGALKAAERLQKLPPVDLISWLQRWCYDVFSVKLSGRIRYYPRYRQALTVLAARAQTPDLLQLIKAVNERRAICEHPLSARLFLEDMLLAYSSAFSR